ncbi:hypothetical protein VCR6J2_470142 [Vibrio coralliirubri]|nr:hypothetical protein VCR6J2_470142 [Vibrio coralliirubri]
MTIDDCFITRWGAVNNSERRKVKLEESDGGSGSEKSKSKSHEHSRLVA